MTEATAGLINLILFALISALTLHPSAPAKLPAVTVPQHQSVPETASGASGVPESTAKTKSANE